MESSDFLRKEFVVTATGEQGESSPKDAVDKSWRLEWARLLFRQGPAKGGPEDGFKGLVIVEVEAGRSSAKKWGQGGAQIRIGEIRLGFFDALDALACNGSERW
ncbi:MAG: hypothetical protein EAZ65_01525 [Verrucomicrobia bacterium]|nr:MAG: hypothetical protein EAZ84_06440 [Verrucomicrobiota bacterium]TAE89120.1 MAG: hypothetical protein EAZ82_00375 [Verrucomicrobiota bacterium]TAF28007.1 MAG: hypothetical protein EAZ71_01530 [Verrucomicrobiota bacterium]TAF42854.1 MAG: hypothetical protein EAZ65_01525 [Verrucomicrobiota bacterium]